MKRTIRIAISAKGRGLQPEAIELNLVPLEDEKALDLYRRIVDAVNGVLKNPFPPIKS